MAAPRAAIAEARDTDEGRKYSICMGLGQDNRRCTGSAEAGYAMAALLVGISVMAVLMSMALPVWTTFNKREREAELIWRGQQYARAIGLFQRKYANTYPPNVDILVEQKFLRKKYKDPITSEDFLMIPAAGGGNQPGNPQNPGGKQQPNKGFGTPPGKPQNPGVGDPAPGSGFPGGGGNQPSIGIQGVVSKSPDKSIKIYNGRTKYNEWTFIHVASTQQPGFPGGGQQAPGKEPNPGGPSKNFPPGTRPPVSNPSTPFGPPGSPSGQPPPPGSKPVFGIGNPPKGQQ
jgi:type II secretory pathway pseudopilin PulG